MIKQVRNQQVLVVLLEVIYQIKFFQLQEEKLLQLVQEMLALGQVQDIL